MEPINLSEPTANTSVHALRGKGGQPRTATALFDRLMAQSRPLAVNGGDVAATTAIQSEVAKTTATGTAQQDTDGNPALLALLADQQTAATGGSALRAPEAGVQAEAAPTEGEGAGKIAVDALPEAVAKAIADMAPEAAPAAPQETPEETLVAETVPVPVADDIGTDPTVPLPSKAMMDGTPTDQPAETAELVEDEGQDPVEQDSTADKGAQKPVVDNTPMPQVETIKATPVTTPEVKADKTDTAQETPPQEAAPAPVAAPVAAAQPTPQAAATAATSRPVEGPGSMRASGRPAQPQVQQTATDGKPQAATQTAALDTDGRTTEAQSKEAVSKDAPEFVVPTKDAPVQRTPRGPQMARAEQVDVTAQTAATPVQQTTVAPVAADPVVQSQTDTSVTETVQDTAQTQSEPIDTRDAGWIDTMATQIEASFTENGGDIEIALTPDNLGSVRVRMEIRDGAAQVTIVTETQDAARLFQQNENRLSEMLSKNGLTLTGQDAGTGQRRDGQAGGSAQNGGFGTGTGGRGDDDTGAEAPRTRITNNLVNIIA